MVLMGRKSLIFAILVGQVIGCGFSRNTTRDDPFLPSLSPRQEEAAPGSRLFGKADPQKDTSRDVATSPVNDPFRPNVNLDSSPRGNSGPGIQTNSRQANSQDRASRSALSENGVDESQRKGLSGKPTGNPKAAFENITRTNPADIERETYSDLRRRMDKLGVKKWSLELDEGTMQYHMRCELARRSDPSKAQIFEADDTDELRLMSEVVLNMEEWARKN